MRPSEPGAAPAGSAAPDRGHLLTEQANPASASLDQLSSSELVDLFCREDEKALLAMEAAAPALATCSGLPASSSKRSASSSAFGRISQPVRPSTIRSLCPPSVQAIEARPA